MEPRYFCGTRSDRIATHGAIMQFRLICSSDQEAMMVGSVGEMEVR